MGVTESIWIGNLCRVGQSLRQFECTGIAGCDENQRQRPQGSGSGSVGCEGRWGEQGQVGL